MSEYIVRMPPDMPYEIRAELNAWYVESEPIVRCRDCIWFHREGEPYEPYDENDVYLVDWCECVNDDAVPDGFCSWGVRWEP